MKRHIAYLKHILRHKWFVLVASIRIGAPLWRALVHDLSKFRPREWFAYAEAFYSPEGVGWYNPTNAFNVAWNHHQKSNLHHWQYWMLKEDDPSKIILLPMPKKYVLEMIADWMGAGRAIHGEWDPSDWYNEHYHSIQFNKKTRDMVDVMLSRISQRGEE